MADPLSLVPRVMPGVAVQAIEDDVLVLAGENLTRLTGSLAATMSNVDGVRSVRAIADSSAPRRRRWTSWCPAASSSSSTPGRSRATAVPTTSG